MPCVRKLFIYAKDPTITCKNKTFSPSDRKRFSAWKCSPALSALLLRRKRNRNQTEFCFEYLPRHQSFFVYLLVITDIKGEINDIWLFQYQSNVRRFMCLSDDYVGNVSKFSELKNSQFRLNRDNVVIADNFSPYL